jgi:hypothetical protein
MKDTVPTPMAATFFMAAITKCLFRNECKGEERGESRGGHAVGNISGRDKHIQIKALLNDT